MLETYSMWLLNTSSVQSISCAHAQAAMMRDCAALQNNPTRMICTADSSDDSLLLRRSPCTWIYLACPRKRWWLQPDKCSALVALIQVTVKAYTAHIKARGIQNAGHILLGEVFLSGNILYLSIAQLLFAALQYVGICKIKSGGITDP